MVAVLCYIAGNDRLIFEIYLKLKTFPIKYKQLTISNLSENTKIPPPQQRSHYSDIEKETPPPPSGKANGATDKLWFRAKGVVNKHALPTPIAAPASTSHTS